jgi:hypothetical protein
MTAGRSGTRYDPAPPGTMSVVRNDLCRGDGHFLEERRRDTELEQTIQGHQYRASLHIADDCRQ